jgi:hypothetical protein
VEERPKKLKCAFFRAEVPRVVFLFRLFHFVQKRTTRRTILPTTSFDYRFIMLSSGKSGFDFTSFDSSLTFALLMNL